MVTLLAPAALAATLLLSFLLFGGISPRDPQVLGNQGYRELWRSNGAAAVGFFLQALRADPAFPYRWSDLGDALQGEGQTEKARVCFLRARQLAPRDPQIALRAANFYFRAAETEAALRTDAAVLSQLPDYDAAIFSAYLRMGMRNTPLLLNAGIGANPRAARAFFHFLSARRADDTALPDTVWDWLTARGFINAPLALERARALWLAGRHAEAATLWLREVSAPGNGNLLGNAGFEDAWTGEPFDWRADACAGAEILADSAVTHSGKRALRVRFEATSNLDFHHVSQAVWLTPGRYLLAAWVRTEALSTDSGVGLRVGTQTTETLTGTADWTRVSREFSVTGDTLASVEIFRAPSDRFDNRPRGLAWIDDVSLARVP